MSIKVLYFPKNFYTSLKEMSGYADGCYTQDVWLL